MNSQIKVIITIVILAVILFAITRVYSPQVVQNPTDSTSEAVSYSCNAGKSIVATYKDKEVGLKLSDGREMNLTQTVSADGVRYANTDESFVFWSKGDGALVLENNVEKSFIGCIRVMDKPAGSNLDRIYSNSAAGFSLRLPPGYTVDESYKYEALGPGKTIYGTKFTIPASEAAGTNLSNDSYISVEEIPQTSVCTNALFGGTNTGAAAGNRYEESVYAISGTNPCVAVRYFIHYGVIDNYPAGTVKEFDKDALLKEFDSIRETLVLVQ